MKINKLVILLIIIMAFFIVWGISIAKNNKSLYEESQRQNDILQKDSSKKISQYRTDISNLKYELGVVRGTVKEVEVIKREIKYKWRTKWKTKIVKEIEYVTLPTKDFELKLKEIEILEDLVKKWSLTSYEFEKKYLSEKTAHKATKDDRKKQIKKKNIYKAVLAGIAVILAGKIVLK